MKIPMVDLVSQYRKIRVEILSEMEKVLDAGAFINGPVVQEFGKALAQYLNVKHIIPCANGTDALQIALMAYGFRRNAEVLVPSWTYVATVEVIALLGLKPIFVEVDPDTFNMDTADLEQKMTKNCVAVIPVHLYGQCANIEEIKNIAKTRQLRVIEDTAQALGAEYTDRSGRKAKAGSFGDLGTTSFFPSKNLGCYGDGGALMTNDGELAERLRMIANHGQSKKYVHDIIGVNSRLDALQAAVLNVKLKYLDNYASARNTIASAYDHGLANNENISIPVRSIFSTHVFHQYTVKLSEDIDRDKLRQELQRKGVPTVVYYPLPNHLQKAYQHFGFKLGDLPTTESLMNTVISLPIDTEISSNAQEFVIDAVLASMSSCIMSN